MIYKAFDKQIEFHKSDARIRGVFAGKRGGKTECGAIEAIIHANTQPGFVDNGIDPYLGVILSPTTTMLRHLSMAKFLAYAKPFDFKYHQTNYEVTWPNGSKIYGVSADKAQRLEGLKCSWIWADEIFQMSQQVFLEAMARVADTQGRIWATGSLGVQYTNPKQHFIHHFFKEKPLQGSECFEWATADNPYFPKEELERLKESLDPRTYRQMFTVDWDVPATNLVYDEFDEANLQKHTYDPKLETIISIDWGYAHPMSCLFFQYNRVLDTVHLFDEIVSSKLKLDVLWKRILTKPYRINLWVCDIAGNQEREQTGRSNIAWFREPPRNIPFRYRSTAINYGIPLVRQYIRNGKGQVKFTIDPDKCPKSVDGMRNYSYPEKDGVILNENPVKRDDDCADAIRYFFVNRLDKKVLEDKFVSFNRWGKWQFSQAQQSSKLLQKSKTITK